MSKIIKIILFILYIGIIVFEYIFLLLYKLLFLHEMVFTNVLTMIIVCLLIDFDSKIYKKIFQFNKKYF